MYIIDYNDDYSTLEDIISDMELATNSIINCFDTKEVNIEWHDDIGFQKGGINLEYWIWIIIVGFWAMASMVNKYQWRRAWEAYYKRPLTNGEDHKPPDYKKEEVKVEE